MNIIGGIDRSISDSVSVDGIEISDLKDCCKERNGIMSVIELKNLTKFYGSQRGIENISFNVEQGEILGFIGPNGAGKSTTIRTLLALIHPTSGSASIFGKDCIKEAAEIAKDVGYLPGETTYYDNMTVRELVGYAADLYGKNCDDKIAELSKRLNL